MQIESKQTTFEYRALERQGFCRDCDGTINRGDMAICGYSYRNRGMAMYFHPECIENIHRLIQDAVKENNTI